MAANSKLMLDIFATTAAIVPIPLTQVEKRKKLRSLPWVMPIKYDPLNCVNWSGF
jgi:hypothetical protein